MGLDKYIFEELKYIQIYILVSILSKYIKAVGVLVMSNIKSDKPLYIGPSKCDTCEWLKQFSLEEVKAFSQEELNKARSVCANCRTEFKFDININKYCSGEPVAFSNRPKGKKWNMDKALLRTILILRDSGKTYKEIAAITGKAYATIAKTLSLSYDNEEVNKRIREYMLEVGFVPPIKEKQVV